MKIRLTEAKNIAQGYTVGGEAMIPEPLFSSTLCAF